MNLYMTVVIDFVGEECFVSTNAWRHIDDALGYARDTMRSYGCDLEPLLSGMKMDLVELEHTEVYTPDMSAMIIVERTLA